MRSTIILMAVIRASGRHGSGPISPISKLYATEIGSQPITSLRPMEPKTFIGRARPRSLCGLVAMDLGCNAHRVVRIQRDVGIGVAKQKLDSPKIARAPVNQSSLRASERVCSKSLGHRQTPTRLDPFLTNGMRRSSIPNC
jgi:hypothetical protein